MSKFVLSAYRANLSMNENVQRTQEVMRVYNIDSDTSTYWIRKCDVWCRVGLKDYRKDQREAAYMDCFLTETTGNLTRHYSTLHYIY